MATTNAADRIAAQRRGYRTPTICRDVEVGLDDFDDDDIVEYLRDRGYLVNGSGDIDSDGTDATGAMVIDADQLNRIETLVLCGQRGAAIEHLHALVSAAIGRPL